MATKTDPVLLIVKLVDQVTEELIEIQGALEKLDNQLIDPDFNLDDDGELEWAQAQLQALGRRITTDWRIDMPQSDISQMIAIRQMMERKTSMAPGAAGRGAGWLGPGVATTPDLSGLNITGAMRGRRINRRLSSFNEKFRELGGLLKRMTPSIMDWWQVLALLIPVIITLGAALIGVVAALGGMAVAAGSLIGIGLVGWGDNATESMQELRMEMERLKGELFAAIQPAATEFAPISRRFVRGIPEQVARLNDELKRLTSFEKGLAAAGGGLVGWVEDSLDAIADLQEEVVQVALRMGDALGSWLIGVLEFGLKELYKNQDAYLKLADIFTDIIRTLFNLSKAITFALATFKPLFDIVVGLTNWMGSRWVTAVMAAVIGLTALAFILGNVMALMTGVVTMGWLSFLSAAKVKIMAVTVELWKMYTALQGIKFAFATLIGLTGLGLVAMGVTEALRSTSGPGPKTTGASAAQGGTTVNNVNIEGNVGKREMNRLLDHLETQK